MPVRVRCVSQHRTCVCHSLTHCQSVRPEVIPAVDKTDIKIKALINQPVLKNNNSTHTHVFIDRHIHIHYSQTQRYKHRHTQIHRQTHIHIHTDINVHKHIHTHTDAHLSIDRSVSCRRNLIIPDSLSVWDFHFCIRGTPPYGSSRLRRPRLTCAGSTEAVENKDDDQHDDVEDDEGGEPRLGRRRHGFLLFCWNRDEKDTRYTLFHFNY